MKNETVDLLISLCERLKTYVQKDSTIGSMDEASDLETICDQLQIQLENERTN